MPALDEQLKAKPTGAGSAHEQLDRVNNKVLLLAVAALVSIVYVVGLAHYAEVRPIDGDEGYYTTAARLVWEGKVPYQDFAYQQGPLLPYIYSLGWALHPRSLVAMRFLSVACGGIAVFLWGLALLSVKRLPAKVALANFALIVLNPYWLSWNVVVKTFAVANLLMSVTAICFYAALHSGRSRFFLIAGLALGACASVRLLYAPLLPFALLWLLHKEWRAGKLSFPKTSTFLAGATCGVLPIVLSFINSPSAFIFNNVKYRPLLSSHVTLRHRLHSYFSIAVSLLHAPYFVVEVLLAIVGGIMLLKLRQKEETVYTREDRQYFQLAFLMLIVYLGTALIPNPSFDQYFDSPLVPFLVPFVAVGLHLAFRAGTKWPVILAVLAPILFFREINRDAVQCSSSPGLQLSSYRKVTQAIEANSKIDEVVLSFWPGYVFESGRRYFPGSENKFNYYVGARMTLEDRDRYHVVSRDKVANALAAGAVSLFVTYPRVFDEHDDNVSRTELQAFRTVVNDNYSLMATIDDIEIYQRKQPTKPVSSGNR